jgi:hypothetical protein
MGRYYDYRGLTLINKANYLKLMKRYLYGTAMKTSLLNYFNSKLNTFVLTIYVQDEKQAKKNKKNSLLLSSYNCEKYFFLHKTN